jgi:hypothetical protein
MKWEGAMDKGKKTGKGRVGEEGKRKGRGKKRGSREGEGRGVKGREEEKISGRED